MLLSFFASQALIKLFWQNIRFNYHMFGLTFGPLAAQHKFRFSIGRKGKVDRVSVPLLWWSLTRSPDRCGTHRGRIKDCFRAHNSEDSCDGNSTDARSQIGPVQAVFAHCMSSDYQNDRTSCLIMLAFTNYSVCELLSSERCGIHHLILSNPRSINQAKVTLVKLSPRAE